MTTVALLSGNEAIARGAWEAGVDFATGYAGTPSTEILEVLATLPGPRCQWSVNEKVALEVGAGASWAGARVLVTMKHVGVNVAADPLFTLSYTGVRGGLVLVTADDPQQFSSQNEQDNRNYARFAKVPMLEPADSQEARDFTLRAFALSEEHDTPVMLRTVTRLSHAKGRVSFGERVASPVEKRFVREPEKLVMVPAHGIRRHRVVEERTRRLAELAETTDLTREIAGEEGQPGIIAAGVAYQYAREAFPKASFLKLGMTWPLPRRRIEAFAARHRRVIVVEELDPFIEEQVRSWGIAVEGAAARSLVGELNPTLVAEAWGGESSPALAACPADLPGRPPVLCPGCPHRGIFSLLKARRVVVSGDIGCYTLAALPPLAALDTCLCMGASLGVAHGVERALPPSERRQVVAVIGDSTFFHSGLTPLVDLVYNRAHTLTIVLDNRTTAMTGRQQHPGTGRTLAGETTPEISIAALGRAMGIPDVVETDAYDLPGLAGALDRLLAAPGPALLVNRGPCVLLTRKPHGAVLRVDETKCDGCRRCIVVACPALSLTGEGREARAVVDAALCTGCGVCAAHCDRAAFVAAGEGGR
ncbi:MAG TPA: indolepyruvate ferredoxin oxidoreductase subunit alpha [bacterium]